MRNTSSQHRRQSIVVVVFPYVENKHAQGFQFSVMSAALYTRKNKFLNLSTLLIKFYCLFRIAVKRIIIYERFKMLHLYVSIFVEFKTACAIYIFFNKTEQISSFELIVVNAAFKCYFMIKTGRMDEFSFFCCSNPFCSLLIDLFPYIVILRYYVYYYCISIRL